MYWLGLTIVAPAWGGVSTFLFYWGWLSFLGVVACLIGLVRGRLPRPVILQHLFNQFTRLVFFGLLLLIGFATLFMVLPFGRTQSEMIAYWAAATISLVIAITKMPGDIDLLWKQANGQDE